MALIAEDVLLMLLDDDSGKIGYGVPVQSVLGGAILMELALAGAVEVDTRGRWRTAVVVTTGRPAPGDPLLAESLARIAEKPRGAQDLVVRLGKGLQDRLVQGLAKQGVLRRERRRTLGIFASTRWPSADTGREAAVRRELYAVLVQGLTPDPRTTATVAMLAATGRVAKVIEHDAIKDRTVAKRAKELAEGLDGAGVGWVAKAVRNAIAAANQSATAVATSPSSPPG